MKKLTKEDIQKYGTEDEKEFLKEQETDYKYTNNNKYTTQNAWERIQHARTGALVKNKITYEYLTTLRRLIYEWLEEIDAETHQLIKKRI